MIKVKIINRDFVDSCGCGNWLSHWMSFAEKPPVFCSVLNCNTMKLLTSAHVQLIGRSNDYYIIPLCDQHNLINKKVIINDFTELIPAIKNDTCSKISLTCTFKL